MIKYKYDYDKLKPVSVMSDVVNEVRHTWGVNLWFHHDKILNRFIEQQYGSC